MEFEEHSHTSEENLEYEDEVKKEEEEAPAPPAGPSQEDLLTEIRDLLAKK